MTASSPSSNVSSSTSSLSTSAAVIIDRLSMVFNAGRPNQVDALADIELSIQAGDFLSLTKQFKKYVRFAPENIGLNRLANKIDSARLVPAKPALRVWTSSGEEDDWYSTGPFRTTNQLG